MLDELSELQEEDEQYWVTRMEFDVETRSSDGSEIVQKTYTFSWGEEFGDWLLQGYKEKRTEDTSSVTKRDWRVSRKVWWDDPGEVDVEVPQIVSDKLAKRLGCDNVNIKL